MLPLILKFTESISGRKKKSGKDFCRRVAIEILSVGKTLLLSVIH